MPYTITVLPFSTSILNNVDETIKRLNQDIARNVRAGLIQLGMYPSDGCRPGIVATVRGIGASAPRVAVGYDDQSGSKFELTDAQLRAWRTANRNRA